MDLLDQVSYNGCCVITTIGTGIVADNIYRERGKVSCVLETVTGI